MVQYQRFQLANGGVVDIEVANQEVFQGADAVGVGIGTKLVESTKNLSDVLKAIPAMASEMHDAIVDDLASANEVCIEFGFKFGADMSLIVAKSTAEANFKISIKW
jgi:hypothetical protein